MFKNAEVSKDFRTLLNEFGERGDIGFCRFRDVYGNLLPVQQDKVREITGNRFDTIYDRGTVISFGVAFRSSVIDFINSKGVKNPDYELWNKYALEYDRINQILNKIAKSLASKYDGIPLTATIGGVIDKISHVSDYFPMVVSHRVIAELAGLGWRGKNQLIIHEKFSCAIRFASVIVDIPLDYNQIHESQCGECTACEDTCSFIKNRDVLDDYRENCRKYILFLKSKGIEKDICGKCIKACLRSSIFAKQFDLN